MFDSFPDEEEVKDFDSFFIGDGSQSLMTKDSRKNNNFQLTGIASVSDLMRKRDITEKFEDSLKDDLKEFIPELSIDSSVEEYFCKVKKEIFDVFNFMELKSKRLGGRPFREIDLIVSRDDRYLLSYLKFYQYLYQAILLQHLALTL